MELSLLVRNFFVSEYFMFRYTINTKQVNNIHKKETKKKEKEKEKFLFLFKVQ